MTSSHGIVLSSIYELALSQHARLIAALNIATAFLAHTPPYVAIILTILGTPQAPPGVPTTGVHACLPYTTTICNSPQTVHGPPKSTLTVHSTYGLHHDNFACHEWSLWNLCVESGGGCGLCVPSLWDQPVGTVVRM
jgi:hypothetical protein